MTPAPGSPAELEAFAKLQAGLQPLYERLFPDPLAPRTVVVIPSTTFDPRELTKIAGVHHYEERMLCMLMLLRLPRTELLYVTSQRVDPDIIDYYLHLLAGVPSVHARARLHLFSCNDASNVSLTSKILARPRLLARMRSRIADPDSAHMMCFNTTDVERTLAVQLGIPLYGNDPALAHLGSKSGSRRLFREAGVALPPGFEDLRDAGDIAEALAQLKTDHPELRRAVIKLNEGFSGEGNALFSFDGAPSSGLDAWAAEQLPRRIAFEAAQESWPSYSEKFEEMQGIVEAFVETATEAPKRSPSVQCRVTPSSDAEVISTHDQILGGPHDQVFLGARFPAADDYRMTIHEAGERIAKVAAAKGVLGRFAVDFVSVPQPDGGFDHYAIEINLRKGGTTHPFIMLQYLTDGRYDPQTGLFLTSGGAPRFYYASDNLKSLTYQGLLPVDLIDIAVDHGLHFHGALQEGVVFHLIGALSEFGKLGMVAIGASHDMARTLFDRTVAVLDRASDEFSA